MIFILSAICFFAFLMSQIEEKDIGDGNGYNTINKDRCNPQPAIMPYPVNLQEVDIFPGPHSYINSKPRFSSKVINGKKVSKAICGEEGQNGESIVQTQQLHNVEDKMNVEDTSGIIYFNTIF